MLVQQVVADTTKVRIFKQITTQLGYFNRIFLLLLILQRYEFSSKSQLKLGEPIKIGRCCWYYKGTNFQANHNCEVIGTQVSCVVADTTKVRIFKQITTHLRTAGTLMSCCWYYKGTNFQANHNVEVVSHSVLVLLLILQRYEFSSKSQPILMVVAPVVGCCWYYKGTNFQANHNSFHQVPPSP